MSEGVSDHHTATSKATAGRDVIERLLCWGQLFESVLAGVMPTCTPQEFWHHEFLREDLEPPLKLLADIFGPKGEAELFLRWWLGMLADLPRPCEGFPQDAPLLEHHYLRLDDIEILANRGFGMYFRSWRLEPDRIVALDDPLRYYWVKLDSKLLAKARDYIGSGEQDEPRSTSLDEAISRVRSFFEPLEASIFGMTNELLSEHVKETIPRQFLGENVPTITPIFGKHKFQSKLSALEPLPVHLRVILRRLDFAQAAGELVNELLAYLEAVDFVLRFATGLCQGSLSIIKDTGISGPFAPTTSQVISDLSSAMLELRGYWDCPEAQPATHLLMKGRTPHRFLQWAVKDDGSSLLEWMVEAEVAVREENPARSAALAEEVREAFREWLDELVLLCSSWDVTFCTRQDGYLGVNVARGQLSIDCRPLIDATRYSVWLDRSELAAFAASVSIEGMRPGIDAIDAEGLLSLGNPDALNYYVSELVRAQKEFQVIAIGHAILDGMEFLLRLNVSLNGGFLRYQFEDSTILDAVLKPGGSLLDCICFLSYALGVLERLDGSEASLLRSVFFNEGKASGLARWLGVDGVVPGPLQGLIGWNLALARPDAVNRIRDIGEEIPKLFKLFKQFIEASRILWNKASLRIEALKGEAHAVVCTFPSGLRLRGVPDIAVGFRVQKSLQGVVVGEETISDPIVGWEEASDEAVDEAIVIKTEQLEGLAKTPLWPSFFEQEEAVAADNSSWNSGLEKELVSRVKEQALAGAHSCPIELAREVAEFVTSSPADVSTVSFISGKEGSGRTLLCRTLVQPRYSGLPSEFPVLYLRVDRFPQTRLSTVVERLNDHIASEASLDRLQWIAVPNEVLQSLGSELERLSKDMADMGYGSKLVANRLSIYLRYLKKLNGERDFLLLLDGFDLVPESIIPQALAPGIHLLITGSSFPTVDTGSKYLRYRRWELASDALMRANFFRVIAEIAEESEGTYPLLSKLDGSMLRAHAYVNVCLNLSEYRANPNVVEDLLSYARRVFSDTEEREAFNNLLCVLGLYDRPIALSQLKCLGVNVEIANVATDSLPALFSFWNDPQPALGLSHRLIFALLLDSGDKVAKNARKLLDDFLLEPRAEDLLLALRWISYSSHQTELIDKFFVNTKAVAIWREELARLWEQGLYFKRIALLDATEGPMLAAVEAGVGDLREELGWLYNARGLSLLKLGLLDDAKKDLDLALESFRAQFAAGELDLISSVGSATNRLSEVALKRQDVQLATRLSEAALEVLHEGRSIADSSQLRGLTVVAQVQMAKIYIRSGKFDQALTIVDEAKDSIEVQLDKKHNHQLGEISLLRSQALSGLGEIEGALLELDVAIELLLKSRIVEDGIQALLLRARLQQRLGRREAAYGDLEHALSILRYQIFRGRLDFEPLCAFVAARKAMTCSLRLENEIYALEEFITWACHGVRYDGRYDLRALLAYLLVARAGCRKGLGSFVLAVDDLRLATEHYDLLVSQLVGVVGERREQEAVWRSLGSAYADMAELYLAMDEAPLALLVGRRALELARRGRVDSFSLGGNLDISRLPFGPLALEVGADDSYDSNSYRFARLLFCLGQAARRLKLEQASVAYLEQAARSYQRLLMDPKGIFHDKIDEYRQVIKETAKELEQHRDFDGLGYWAEQLEGLAGGEGHSFDRAIVCCWRAKSKAWHGHLAQAEEEYEKALELLLVERREHLLLLNLRSDILFELGRVLSLKGQHARAMEVLERAFSLAEQVVLSEEAGGEGLIERGLLYIATTFLRAAKIEEALNRLRQLASYRPPIASLEFEQLADDWAICWQDLPPMHLEDQLSCLDSMSQLGDWLLCTSLGVWYRELVTSFVNHSDFADFFWDSLQLDRVIETFLVVVFPQFKVDKSYRGGSISDTGELQRLLEAKYRTLRTEGKLVEAELVVSHLLEHKMTPSTGKILLLRSEMALKRADRGMGLVDLLRATDSYGEAKIEAHLRLAEFLYACGLMTASTMHLKRALFSVDGVSVCYSPLLARIESLLTRLVQDEVQLEPEILEEYLRVCDKQVELYGRFKLEAKWLKALTGYREWPLLLELTVTLVTHLQEQGEAREEDWLFLDGVLECTVLSIGALPRLIFKELGSLLALSYIGASAGSLRVREGIWARFIRLLPAMGRRDAVLLLQRLFQMVAGMESADNLEVVREFLGRIEEEVRVFS